MTRRTRTTAVLLLGVAVGGIPACVAVEPGAGTGAGAGVGTVRAAPPRGPVEPRIAQPPAREVLEAADPPARAPATPRAVAEAVPPPPGRPEPVRPPAPRPGPALVAPPKVPDLPDTGTELCALGGRYGGWAPDSPHRRVCEAMYGD
ncbi:hypothetical protein [Streptomyces sp. IB2014 016-6]|uniref:hypothetical protein n=1 Tax=Streptomyces sp. IB2014 016-6 TaxID=2517818 RepID=UPI0011C8C83A|nr:hypothetical protein [Streptomyces sp. IB2014 016-6]TXL88276.1 hypothetical protein EW053_19395 [Streptomyces sp. IB2014 016-6]